MTMGAVSAAAYDVITVVIDGEPVPKARPRVIHNGGSGRVFTPKKTIEAEQRIGWEIRRVYPGLLADPERRWLVWARFDCVQGSDVDNLTKLVLDAANRIIWVDDRQVERLDIWRRHVWEKPCTRLRYVPLPVEEEL